MKILILLISLMPIWNELGAETLTIEGLRENLLNSPSGSRIGTLQQGARMNKIEERGDWVKISVEGWVWKGSVTPTEDTLSTDFERNRPDSMSTSEILKPSLLKKGYVKEGLQEMVWFDIAFDTSKLSQKTRAIKGALIISDLFDEAIMRIHWTINQPLSPGEEYIEKGTNFAYNDFLSHHQWVRFTKREDMKVSFQVRHIIYEDGSRKSYYR